MLQQGNGRIFIIGSRPRMSSKEGKGMVAYGLGKSLIFRLAELMNDEAKGHNVVTSVVVPARSIPLKTAKLCLMPSLTIG